MSTSTSCSRTWTRKRSRLQPVGSRGWKRTSASLSRSPPKPATSASHVPPQEAMWMPSAVLPCASSRSTMEAIPIMYYNLPSASGVTLDASQLRELRRTAGVTSLKDTGGDAVAATELIQAEDGAPTLLNGWDTLTFAALAAGVRAVVWGTASISELARLLERAGANVV